jgi:tetratricopeptide (TPR) repeat protein
MLSRMSPSPADAAPPPDEEALRGAVADHPDSAEAHAALASFLCSTGRADEALTQLDREIRRRPSKIWPLSIKAGIFSSERRAEEALEIHRTLVAAAPGVPIFWANFGNDLAAVGDVSEAAAAFRKTVELAPDFGPAWLGLATLPAMLGDTDVAAMEKALVLVRDPFHRIQLLFALGRAYGARGAFDRSFEIFTEANTLRDTLVPHDGAGLAAFVEAHRILRPSLFAATATASDQADSAIFIVGMPRSGTTLVEQILASHPEVEGAGELFALSEVAASMGAFDSPDAFVRRLRTMTHAEAAQHGTDYLKRAGRYRRTDRRYFTDKMPANWRLIALIRRILPGARIIDVRRAPLACCFSAYTTYFNRHTDFPNTLEDLGRYYRHYLGMMELAQAMAPDSLYRLDHARLVSNTEQEIRALLAFLQLPFSPSCLSPERNSQAIHTPSAQQVRAPIHHEQDRSHIYLRWLKPLQAALEAG